MAYGLDPENEWFAGYIDGTRAGRIAFLNTVRAELVRFGRSVSDDFECLESDDAPILLSLPSPDNPLDDEDYREGWDRGFADSQRNRAESVRTVLLQEADLYVADEGHVTTVETASHLVSWFRTNVTSRDTKAPLTDDAIHAFIDRLNPEEDEITTAAKATSAAASLLPPPAPRTPAPRSVPTAEATARSPILLGRRAAVAVLVSAISASFLTWLWVRPEPKREPEQTQQQGWVPPTSWDHFSSGVKGIYLAMDQYAYGMEQAGQTAQLAALAAAVMGSNGNNAGKQFIIGYVKYGGKEQYLEALLPGLSPAVSTADIRALVIGSVERLLKTRGNSAMPLGIRGTLEAYRSSGTETDPVALNMLNRVIQKLLAAGL